MRRQSYCPSSSGNGVGEPLIVVEESTLGEEEADRCRAESPPRCVDPDSPSLNPYLLSPWRDARKHSLPTPQCTSGITASQVRRLSERGGEGSGPSAREAAFLATLSQTPAPQSGGRRHSVVTISRVPTTLFGRNRRESIAAFPMGGATRILQSRRDSSTGLTGPPSNSGSTHNLQLDIMDDIAEIKARKVRLKMYKTPSRERVCEIQPLEGNGSATQKYIQHQKRRFSEFSASVAASTSALRRRASEMTRPLSEIEIPGTSAMAAGITCSNTDLISILSSLTSSATEINTCGTSDASSARDEQKSSWSSKTAEQRRSRLKSSRSNSFDVSILHSTKSKTPTSSGKSTIGTFIAPSSWFAKRHQPISKKSRYDEESATTFKLDKSRVVKTVKDTLSKNVNSKHKVLGNAIEKILTSGHRGSDAEASGSSSGKPSVSPNKSRTSKVASWFTSGNKEQEQPDCDSICSTLKDLFVK
ncbi:uncharacterized protein LOC105198933 isoform X2 [Solenopsis invicta]|uniref:uncharacterized protein LOC105198933 isoform X2 n=1 Tax=Solenopsis invicta TaxID=13686 RepID=UPI00193CC547|nr:uncharacterized protein LOC105198933 isoform X2 [Solenopsis invicta]